MPDTCTEDEILITKEFPEPNSIGSIVRGTTIPLGSDVSPKSIGPDMLVSPSFSVTSVAPPTVNVNEYIRIFFPAVPEMTVTPPGAEKLIAAYLDEPC